MADDELFNKAVADYNRDEALDRVERNAPDYWKSRAWAAIKQIAKTMELFTVDDVKKLLADVPPPHEPKAMGAIMTEARKLGWMVKVGVVNSTSVTHHSGYVTQWKSLIYVGA
jgi:hypothetical protein